MAPLQPRKSGRRGPTMGPMRGTRNQHPWRRGRARWLALGAPYALGRLLYRRHQPVGAGKRRKRRHGARRGTPGRGWRGNRPRRGVGHTHLYKGRGGRPAHRAGTAHTKRWTPRRHKRNTSGDRAHRKAMSIAAHTKRRRTAGKGDKTQWRCSLHKWRGPKAGSPRAAHLWGGLQQGPRRWR